MKTGLILFACLVFAGCAHSGSKRTTASSSADDFQGSNYQASCVEVEGAISCLAQDNCSETFKGGRLIARELILTAVASNRLSQNLKVNAQQSLTADEEVTKQSCYEIPPSSRCDESLYAKPPPPPPAPGRSQGLIPPAYHEKALPESGTYHYQKPVSAGRTERITFEIPYCE